MQTALEREKSLKKLHQCIANYKPSHQEKASLIHSQQQMMDKIEIKFKRSTANQSYLFPRKHAIVEEFSDGVEVVDLHKQPRPEQEPDGIEVKQKPKIKLAKPRIEKRVQTEHAQRPAFDQKPIKIKIQSYMFDSEYRLLKQVPVNFETVPVAPAKQRVRTEYVKEQEQNCLAKSAKKSQKSYCINALWKEGTSSKSKSKLNMLTKSYMNLKNNKLPLENSVSRQCAPNSIRTNDYKFMPNSSSVRPVSAFQNDANSTRDLKQTFHYNPLNASIPLKEGTAAVDVRDLQKIGSLLPDRKYLKAK